jgi:hypothetical protein
MFFKFNVDGLLRGDYVQPHERLCHWEAERLDVGQ